VNARRFAYAADECPMQRSAQGNRGKFWETHDGIRKTDNIMVLDASGVKVNDRNDLTTVAKYNF